MRKPVTDHKANLGTFFGVYLPCLLTILGVILFVRLGWVVGNLGLIETWLLVSLATSITFITGLSVAAMATNMKVGGGGSYYMISRSLGLEAGAAIGLPLFIGKALGVSFYVVGFAESLEIFFPEVPLALVGSCALLVLTALALISTQIAARSQFLVFSMITVSLIGLAFGAPPEASMPSVQAPESMGFWIVFAVFFPAVTGIEAGVGLSGDLKNPQKSLPLGTIGAIFTSYSIYMIVPLLLIMWVPMERLRTEPLIMREIMPHPALFYCGIWGAALSSALISLLAAPRTLQKLARDHVVPTVLGQGSQADDTPRVATFLTFLIALAGIWLGGLNEIAKALSMFFLTTYGLLNFATAMESLLDNPSWRPTFRVKWWVSMVGAIASFSVLFLLNGWTALIAITVGVGIYVWVHKRHLHRRWQDIRTGLWLFLIRTLLYRLRDYESDIRNWRPNLLVFAGAPTKRWYLVELAQALSQNRGIMTLVTMIREQEPEEHAELLEQSMIQILQKGHVTALTRVYRTDNLLESMRHLIQYYGIGPLQPNTVLLGHSYDFSHRHDFSDLIIHACRENHNLILAREEPAMLARSASQKIDLWWNGHKRNLGFMLAIAYLIKHSHAFSDIHIQIHSILTTGTDRDSFASNLHELLNHARVEAETFVWSHDPTVDVFAEIRRLSADAEVVLMGMRDPRSTDTPESYGNYYGDLLKKLPQNPLLIQVIAAEDLPFFDLFR